MRRPMPIQSPSNSYPSIKKLHSVFIAEYDRCHGISLWSTQIRWPGYVPSQLLTDSQPTPCEGSVRNRENLGTVQVLITDSQNTVVLSTLF